MTELPHDRITGTAVVLRELRESDADDVRAACDDPLTARFLDMLRSPYTRDDARTFILQIAPTMWARGGTTFAIADPATDRLLGSVGSHGPSLRGFATSVGYWVAPWARGRGVATAATRALVPWLFDHGFGRIELITDVANAASQRVALASGFHHEGVRRAGTSTRSGGRADAVVWSRLTGDDGEPAARVLPDLPGGGLTDGVVTVQRLVPEDAEDLNALRLIPDVAARSGRGRVPTIDRTREFCAQVEYRWLIGERASMTIRDAESTAFAGDFDVFHVDGSGQAMIAYDLRPEWRGRGLVTRAVRAFADWAFNHDVFARLIAGTEPDNIASQRVLARAGFHREGYERDRLPAIGDGPRRDNISFALLRP